MRTDVDKKKRHEIIKEVIRSKPIGTQEELVAEIKNRQLDVTQTTISRDLVELEVGKWNGQYHIPYEPGESPAWFETIRKHVTEFKKIGEHLIVLKTDPGASAFIEKTLNEAFMSEIAGVVASQATVLIAFENIENQNVILEQLKKI